MLQLPLVLISSCLLGLKTAAAAPHTHLEERAGGPGYLPINESICSVSYPLTNLSTSEAEAQSFYPSLPEEFQVYSYDLASTAENYTTLWQNCLEQCNYLHKGATQAGRPQFACNAAFLANNVPNQAGYVPEGSFEGWACKMYNTTLNETNLLPTTDNMTYTQAIAGNIMCNLTAQANTE